MEYNHEDVKNMVAAYEAKNRSRLQEMIDYAKVSGYGKIGIASCLSTHKYALKLQEILEGQGFKVYAMHCKESGLEVAALSEKMSGISCDPLAQAEYLNNVGTEFNIDAGLCLGHGLLFQKYSKAPVTTFIVKDPSTAHNPVEVLK